MTHKVRTAYGKKKPVRIKFTGVTKTKQSFKDECDINKLVDKYTKTGAISHVNKHAGSYGYASAADFTESMQIVAKGQTMFQELPSKIRTKFDNDPAKFLEFVQDEKNVKEMQELGLAHKRSNETEPSNLAEKSEAIIKEESEVEKTETSESEAKK